MTRPVPLWFLLLLAPGLCASMAITNNIVKGSAAKPFEKKTCVVFGAGGYLGACIYGFLQRASSLYGTGIQNIQSPRAITATSAGSVALNKVLGKEFILAQADESFVKLTDMSSLDSIKSRVNGFDAAIMATSCTFEPRPVTPGSYETSPNSKTNEVYFDKPRSRSILGKIDKEMSMDLFKKSLEACRDGGVKRIVVVETHEEMDEDYLNVLKQSGLSYAYITCHGKLDNRGSYSFATGVENKLNLELVDALSPTKETSYNVYREDLAAVCVQSLLSLPWNSNAILQLENSGPLSTETTTPTSKEWCVNSVLLETFISEAMVKSYSLT